MSNTNDAAVPWEDLPWSQLPEYLEAVVKDAPLGESTGNVHPRWVSPSDPQDRTSYMHGQRNWTLSSLPSILYKLDPCKDWKATSCKGQRPGVKIDAQGREVLGFRGQPLLDFPVLPDRIGSLEHPLFFEAWRRLDPRIKRQDLEDRMWSEKKVPKRTLENRAKRLRCAANVYPWKLSALSTVQHMRQPIVNLMSQEQLAANSTRGLALGDLSYGHSHGRTRRSRPDEVLSSAADLPSSKRRRLSTGPSRVTFAAGRTPGSVATLNGMVAEQSGESSGMYPDLPVPQMGPYPSLRTQSTVLVGSAENFPSPPLPFSDLSLLFGSRGPSVRDSNGRDSNFVQVGYYRSDIETSRDFDSISGAAEPSPLDMSAVPDPQNNSQADNHVGPIDQKLLDPALRG